MNHKCVDTGLTSACLSVVPSIPLYGWMAETGNFPAIMTDEAMDIITGLSGFPTDDASKEALTVSNLYLEVPYAENVSEINSALDSYHGSIMSGEMSIDDGIAAMNEAVQAIINP